MNASFIELEMTMTILRNAHGQAFYSVLEHDTDK